MENSFNIEIAKTPIKIIPYTDKLAAFCIDFLTNQNGITTIEITEKEIKEEKEHFKEYYHLENNNELQLEQLALLRVVSAYLAKEKDTYLIHTSALVFNGKAYLFTGKSGTGKTTHCKKWIQLIEGVEMLSDDKPFLKRVDEKIVVYGSPWSIKEGIGKNVAAPLGGVICMQQAEHNEVKEMSYNDKWDFLFGQMIHSEDAETMKRTMAFLNKIIEDYPVIKLECNMEDEAVEIMYNAVMDWDK